VAKDRADKIMVLQGLAPSREKAQALIMSGLVYAGGRRIEKPGERAAEDEPLRLLAVMPYVGRGGLKLEKALAEFRIPVAGKVAADLGASTGGFTDCLLQGGARKVYAIDVDPRQLDSRLAADPRVVRVRKNARLLGPDDFEEAVEVATMDLSFISLLKVLPAVATFLSDGDLVALVKPQFEAGRRQVGKKGIVRDRAVHEDVLGRVAGEASRLGFGARGLCASPVRGQRGNREFFIHWTRRGNALDADALRARIKEIIRDESD
jgi:23S rRNA (cytidine1920-2'-O)/16S rRNA (cytidine1409-2'-O)-methyltransferase